MMAGPTIGMIDRACRGLGALPPPERGRVGVGVIGTCAAVDPQRLDQPARCARPAVFARGASLRTSRLATSSAIRHQIGRAFNEIESRHGIAAPEVGPAPCKFAARAERFGVGTVEDLSDRSAAEPCHENPISDPARGCRAGCADRHCPRCGPDERLPSLVRHLYGWGSRRRYQLRLHLLRAVQLDCTGVGILRAERRMPTAKR
jgi:hypothetical protein